MRDGVSQRHFYFYVVWVGFSDRVSDCTSFVRYLQLKNKERVKLLFLRNVQKGKSRIRIMQQKEKFYLR